MLHSELQPTPPLRGAAAPTRRSRPRCRYFNPRSPCGERRVGWGSVVTRDSISTHAPHAGSDAPGLLVGDVVLISTHALPSCRRRFRRHLNPRSPCGERPHGRFPLRLQIQISIHAPHAGSDPMTSASCRRSSHFNPRSPCGERLDGLPVGSQHLVISIHAPLAGSDSPLLFLLLAMRFQSTLPLRGATRNTRRRRWATPKFQSTLPLRGATPSSARRGRRCSYFNPRSPCGERRPAHCGLPKSRYFNPRSPCGERPGTVLPSWSLMHFNPRSPCGERRPRAT